MIATSGRRTLVASSRPPNPTSATSTSTAWRAKVVKAIAVMASKVVTLLSRSISGRNSSTSETTSARDMSSPPVRMRSRKVCRWGEV